MLVDLKYDQQELWEKNIEAYDFKRPNDEIKILPFEHQIELLNEAEMTLWKDINLDIGRDQTDHVWIKCPLCKKEMTVTHHFESIDRLIYYIYGKCYYCFVQGMVKFNFIY